MKHFLLILTTTALVLLPTIAHAQTYQPSNRIPVADNSQIGTQVKNVGSNNFGIDGGLQRGQNLFHSFTDFSIPTNGSANFTNPVGNQSIITRVTGNLFSDINGTLRTNGANFLLINPQGVVFGSGAKLDVGKAFVTSTASGVDFVDAAGRNYNFGVNKAGDAPLLTIDPNVAFNPARLIMNTSIPGSRGIENYGTLETNNPGQYIGLIGGNVTFNGGKITAPGAKVELGGLKQSGTIGFSLENGVQFPANVDRGNVSLVTSGTSPSVIDVRAGGGGSVGIFAKDIVIVGTDTRIAAGIAAGLGSPTAKAGDIKLDATGNITLSDGAFIFNAVSTGAEGKGGEIEIVTGNLSVTDGVLAATTLGKGDAGNIKIKATGNVSFAGGSDTSVTAASSLVEAGAEGNSGGIEISAASLSVTNGAQFQVGIFGKGNAGNIKITTTGNVSFYGFAAALNAVETGAEGNVGGIEISAANLSITNGALNTTNFGKGNAGNIKITTTGNVSFDGFAGAYNSIDTGVTGKNGTIEISAANLSVTNGADLSVSTFGKGDAGNIKINATGNVSFNNGYVFSTVAKGAEGKGGEIEISAPNLSIINGSGLVGSMEGKGSAGNIFLKSSTITLDKGFVLSRSTNSNGGNINIVTTDYLLLQNDSRITTDSDSTGKNGNGGNITINSPLIVARPAGNFGGNDITANAYQGNGGKVTIDSQGLFGIQYHPKGTDVSNDITASSTFGQSGSVQINTPGTDPGKDKGEIVAAPNDASKQISQACGASQRDNKFYITGRGGLPPNASEPQESDALWEDPRAVKATPATTTSLAPKYAPPAIALVLEKNGRARLISAQSAGELTGTKVVCPNVGK